MALEIATHINDLVITNPAGGDDLGQGDDHLRMLKDVLKRDLPMTAAATASGLAVLQGTPTAARTALGITTPTAFRNRVINGDMAIDQAQLSASVTITAGAVLRRLCDQFYGYCTGANITTQQITFNGYNRQRFTGGAANTGLGFATRLESNNVDDLVSNTATLSLRTSSTSITTLTWTAYYATTTNVFGTLATPTRTQIATGTFTINGTEATYNAQMAVPAGAHTGIEIVFTCGALLAAQTLDFGDIQLEKGAIASSDVVFEVVEKGTQLARCQYHYERVVILVTGVGSFVQQTSYSQKRATPVLTIGSFSAGTGATVANLTQGGITSGLYQNANHSQAATADVYVDAGLF